MPKAGRDEVAGYGGELVEDLVLHCPCCHGHEVRDEAIGVLGGDNRPFVGPRSVPREDVLAERRIPFCDNVSCRGPRDAGR